MALILLGILFVFGATGMETRRGITFSVITGALVFAWMVPVIVETDASVGPLYLGLELVAVLLGLLCLSVISFFAGRWTRSLMLRFR